MTLLERSTGKLHYAVDNHQYKIWLSADKGLADYYRALVPKWHTINKPKYPPHISVLRKEIPKHNIFWRLHDGKIFDFWYSPIVHHNEQYYWLNAFSKSLEGVRLELGLPVESEYTRPPGKFRCCFHLTIGNSKPVAAQSRVRRKNETTTC